MHNLLIIKNQDVRTDTTRDRQIKADQMQTKQNYGIHILGEIAKYKPSIVKTNPVRMRLKKDIPKNHKYRTQDITD